MAGSNTPKVIAAGAVGNVLEWYDFAVYGYFAAAIGRAFFPQEDRVAQVLAAFGIFAVGFLMRPVGGALIGYIGDRFGRRTALTVSVAAMAIPTFLVGVLPGYQTLGVAYSSFGNYDSEIDGRADPVGVNSPQWTGFYRLEYGLWHGQAASELTPVANTLNTNVHQLLAWWPTQQVEPLDLVLRTHEVMENALEFQLTGHDDYGSGTTLASTLANITADRYLLSLLHPLLVTRYSGLPAVYTWLDRLQSLLEKEHLRNGSWVSVSALPTTTREDIDAACSQLLQELAPIASIAEPRIKANDF